LLLSRVSSRPSYAVTSRLSPVCPGTGAHARKSLFAEQQTGFPFPATWTPTHDTSYLEHFSCCWDSRNNCAVAFSLRKTPMSVEALDYTHRKHALVIGISNDDVRLPQRPQAQCREARARRVRV